MDPRVKPEDDDLGADIARPVQGRRLKPAPETPPPCQSPFPATLCGLRTQSSSSGADHPMNLAIFRAAGVAALIFAPAGGAAAQVSANRVASHGDWDVFVEENPKICWGISAARQGPGSGDGDTHLFVTYNFGSAAGEVSFSGGYRFDEDATVELDVDGRKFPLFTQDDWAWANSPEADAAIVAAFSGGSAAAVTVLSPNGATRDMFSLRGVKEALQDAAGRCGT